MHKYRETLLFIALGFLLLSNLFIEPIGSQGDDPHAVRAIQDMSYSEFLMAVEDNRIMTARITDTDIEGETINGAPYRTKAHWRDDRMIDRLIDGGVEIQVEESEANPFLAFLLSFVPWALMLFFILWFFNRGKGGRGIFSVGKSRAVLVSDDKQVTFADVAGIDEAKEDLTEIVEYLRNPEKFLKLGGRIPKGILLVGPPGTGKTLTAKAVAGEAKVPFYSVSGSDFVEMFVGVGASRVRDMFEQARKTAPCIIFIDEIDAVGRARGGSYGGANDEREQTLNQLLVEMDGFSDFNGVIVMAATNRPDVLDPALLRPGRFDRQVVVSAPDVTGREAIIKVHAGKVPLAGDVDLRAIARSTPGFSGADLANLVNEAALMAARAEREQVTMTDLEAAKDKVLMGAERKSMVMSDHEKKLTAYHEAGHALISLLVEGNDPLHKVTIIPRGRALGVTMSLPESDRHGYTKKEVLARMAMMFGGRAAEEIIFGEEEITTGAGNDIQQATRLARKMVREWGMSESVGPLDYAEAEGESFLGYGMPKAGGISEETSREIDLEVKALIKGAEEKARKVLMDNIGALHRMAAVLLEQETINGEEAMAILRTQKDAFEQA